MITKERIKNVNILYNIEKLQLKLNRCFENKNIIYCNSIFIQLPTIQFKIIEINPISFLKREDTITIIFKYEPDYNIIQIESTRELTQKEGENIKNVFEKNHSVIVKIYTPTKEDMEYLDFEKDSEYTEEIIKEQRTEIENKIN